MRKYYKPVLLLLFMLPLTIRLTAQVNPGILVGIGTTVGGKLLQGAGDKKRAKLIQSSLSEVSINGNKIMMLRVPEDKITANLRVYIVKVQQKLDEYYRKYNNTQHLDIDYFDDLDVLKSTDPEWPSKYYQEELVQYKQYEAQLQQREKIIRDSLEMVRRAEIQRINDSTQLAIKKEKERIDHARRVEGYHFINKEVALLKEKPADNSQTLGRIHVGSYIEVKGYSDNSTYVKVALKDIVGYIKSADIVDDIDKITVPNADLATYKSRQYYKYDPNYDYTAPVYHQPEALYQSSGNSSMRTSTNAVKTVSSTKPASSSSRRSSSSGRTYIRGPRGGCYYINSNGNKTYVDHAYCGG